jgi:hypothetical protein
MALTEHRRFAEALRERVATAPAATDAGLRRAALGRAAPGSSPLPAPYDGLVRQIDVAAPGVTDAQVAAVRAALGSDKAAFELVMAACIGAGLRRWDRAMAAIAEASDAAR